MTLDQALISVWHQALVEGKAAVELDGESYPVTHTPSKKLRTVDFTCQSHRFTGIEQNPRTSSRWAELARQGKRIMQFSHAGGYVGNVCEGKLVRYGAWAALGLPAPDEKKGVESRKGEV
jgi:hypothetical protein